MKWRRRIATEGLLATWLVDSAHSGITKDPDGWRARKAQGCGGSGTLVGELLDELFKVELDKALAAQDHSVGERPQPAKQEFSQGQLALLLLDNPLDSIRSKSRRFISRTQAAPRKEIAAILLLELLPADALRLSQNGSDPLA